jgi:two-component system, chemotaxis family, protein-glutamate methylesterase/glutaminase
VACNRYQIVVIAASAGGIEAISTVLGALPSTYPIPIAVVQHRAKGPTGMLGAILGRATSLRVKDADSGEALRAGSVYLAPGDTHLAITGERIVLLTAGPKVCFARPSADVLFGSAAEVYGCGVIAIVLTGGNNDATDGALLVRQAGGIVIAQDRMSSQQFSMPGSAIAAGAVDLVLPLSEIGPWLISLAGRGGP